MEKRERPTEAVQKGFEAKMKAAGITVVTDAPSTITLLRRKTTEEMLAEAKAAGVEVTVMQPPKGTGKIVPLPGIRAAADERRDDLLQDDDGSGLVD